MATAKKNDEFGYTDTGDVIGENPEKTYPEYTFPEGDLGNQFTPFRDNVLLYCMYIEGCFSYDGDEYEGAYVCRSNTGEDFIVPADEFNEKYTPVAPAKLDT